MPGTPLQCQCLTMDNSKQPYQFSLNLCVHLFSLPVYSVKVTMTDIQLRQNFPFFPLRILFSPFGMWSLLDISSNVFVFPVFFYIVSQAVKNLPEMQEAWVQSMGHSRLPGEGNGSSILAWTIPWTEESGGLHFIVSQKVRHH